MQHRILIAAGLTLMLKGNAMAQERIRISSEWGNVTADLVDSEATRSLVRMLPLTIDMTDHLRQEKNGNLPSPLPAVARKQDFSSGTLGLWGTDHFVIYYRSAVSHSLASLSSATSQVMFQFLTAPVQSLSDLSVRNETLPSKL